MRGRLTHPARRRLRRKSDFEAAYARGRRLGNGFFAVTAMPNDIGGPRLGLAVSVKNAGTPSSAIVFAVPSVSLSACTNMSYLLWIS